MATVRHLGLFPSQLLCVRDVSLANLGNLSRYPDIWMPVEDVMAMYWRVKKWRYSFNGNWSYSFIALSRSFTAFHTGSHSSEFSVGQLTVTLRDFTDAQTWFGDRFFFDFGLNVPRPAAPRSGGFYTYGEIPTSETKLICGPQSFTYPSFDEDEDGNPIIVDVEDKHHFSFGYESPTFVFDCGVIELPPEGPDGDIEVLSRSAFSYNASYIYRSTGFPQGDIPAFYRETSNGREYILALNFSALLGRYSLYGQALGLSSEMDAGTFTYKFLGKTYTAPIVARPISFGSSRTPVNVSAQFTLEATEYWPYDPGDGGGPIYDSSTGEQLRNFPS
jgi:hypothetical protein